MLILHVALNHNLQYMLILTCGTKSQPAAYANTSCGTKSQPAVYANTSCGTKSQPAVYANTYMWH